MSLVSGPSESLLAGQVYQARVSRVHAGQLELAIGDSCLLADSVYRFRQGDWLSLRCMGRQDGRLRFELVMPEGGQARESLAALARASGVSSDKASVEAVAELLRLGLPVRPGTVALRMELQRSDCQLDGELAAVIMRLQAAGLDIDQPGLAAYGKWRQGGGSLAGLIRCSCPQLAGRLLAGADGIVHSPAAIRGILHSLYGSPSLVTSNDGAAGPESCCDSLAGLLALLATLAELEKPKLRFRLPCTAAGGDFDIEIEYTALGRRNYRQCFSAMLSLQAAQRPPSRIQLVDTGSTLQVSMLAGDDSLPERMRRISMPGSSQQSATQASGKEGRSLATRLPHTLMEQLARMVAVLQERC